MQAVQRLQLCASSLTVCNCASCYCVVCTSCSIMCKLCQVRNISDDAAAALQDPQSTPLLFVNQQEIFLTTREFQLLLLFVYVQQTLLHSCISRAFVPPSINTIFLIVCLLDFFSFTDGVALTYFDDLAEIYSCCIGLGEILQFQ